MAAKKTKRYIDILPKLVDSYNKTWHTGILSEPSNVNKNNEKKLWWQMYWPDNIYTKKEKKRRQRQDNRIFLFKIGDKVRISYLRKAFQ